MVHHQHLETDPFSVRAYTEGGLNIHLSLSTLMLQAALCSLSDTQKMEAVETENTKAPNSLVISGSAHSAVDEAIGPGYCWIWIRRSSTGTWTLLERPSSLQSFIMCKPCLVFTAVKAGTRATHTAKLKDTAKLSGRPLEKRRVV